MSVATAKQPRQRFSLISLFTNNSTPSSRKSRKSRTQTKNKPKDEEASTGSARGSFYHVSRSPGESTSAPSVSQPIHKPDDTTTSSERRECPLCFDDCLPSEFPELQLSCQHRSCDTCLEQYLKIEIGESRVDVTCPECSERLHPTDIQKILNNEDHMNKYEEFMLRRVLVSDPDTRWCPAPDCGYAVIAYGCAGCPMLVCQRPGCNTKFCYHCKQEWHANQTCDTARLERLPLLRLPSDSKTFSVEEYKPCPRCKTVINKMDDGSCNHMTCSICHAQFCWLCLKEATDLHYLSPSGCTFWGKKPWSKKKKILWQLGVLIGAPVGIALIAGLSVPMFIIGLPIVIGRRIYRKFKTHNRHKRNALVTFGSIFALLVSPVAAALTIAIGVPVMLAYVYGVVPISLCRGGDCGVKDENDTIASLMLGGGPSNSTTDLPGRIAPGDSTSAINPSIGPSIGEASLVTSFQAVSASDILMDNQSDRHSASVRNLVGTSITGSIYDPETSAHQKLEIQADVNRPASASTAASGDRSSAVVMSVRRKNSIDSVQTNGEDSRSLAALDNRSIRSFGQHDNRSHVSFNVDNASIKALAGSISAPRDHDGMSIVLPNEQIAAPSSSDMKSRGCMRVDHGSPVSNRSVSFATATGDEPSSSSKKGLKSKKRRRDSDKSDKLSQRSFDSTLPNSTHETNIGRRTEAGRQRVLEPLVIRYHSVDYTDSMSQPSSAPSVTVSMTEVDTGDKPPSSSTIADNCMPNSTSMSDYSHKS